MANDNNPRGLIPLDWPYTKVHAYRITTGGDVFLGQGVDAVAAGYVSAVTITGIQTLIGVVVGFTGPNESGLATNAPFLDVSDLTPVVGGLPAGDRFAIVADDPDQLYVVQEDTGGTALTLAETWSSIDGIFRGTDADNTDGNTNTGWANLEIDASSVVQTTAATFQIVKLYETVNSDGTRNAVGDYAKWVIKILHHRMRGANIMVPVV